MTTLNITVRLPRELIRYIGKYLTPEILYSYNSLIHWDDIYYHMTNIEINGNSIIISDIFDIFQEIYNKELNKTSTLEISSFDPHQWMYYDYFKGPDRRKIWFWDDDITDYEDYKESLIQLLYNIDMDIQNGKYFNELSCINSIYKYIIDNSDYITSTKNICLMGWG